MKTIRLPKAARGFGAVALLSCVFAFRPGVAQQFDPIIGPRVRITSPANHAVFYAPVDIPIFAYVVRETGSTTNVEFFAGTNDLGRGFDLGSTVVPPTPIYGNFVFGHAIPRLGSVYCLVWTNAPLGSYALTAVAKSSNIFTGIGLSRTSAPVNITILASTTNSNPTDIVSIVASDPIAIAGTNSFVWLGMTNTTPVWTNWPPPHWQSFTNWGPKNALFTVRRFGDAADAITLNYQISGTASNGVDYAALPGYLTIPAGGAYGLIPIVPIDNGPSNIVKTVVLTLKQSSNSPPDYVVGFPARATALILKHWPRPLPWLLANGGFHLNAAGPDGAWFCVQNSTDLLNWTSVSTNQVLAGSIDFVDPDASGRPSGFYRAVPLASPPSD